MKSFREREDSMNIENTRHVHNGYGSISWVCKHYGTPRCRSTGIRTNQVYLATGCRWRLSANYVLNELGGYWEIIRYFSRHHNHEIGPDHFNRIKSSRRCLRDDKDIVKQVAALLALNMKPRSLKEYIERTVGGENENFIVKMKDVHNLIQYIRSQGGGDGGLIEGGEVEEGSGQHTNGLDEDGVDIALDPFTR